MHSGNFSLRKRWDITNKSKSRLGIKEEKNRNQNIIRNNLKDIKNRIEHKHKVGDLVLILKLPEERAKEVKLTRPTEGSYEITQTHNNAEVTIYRGSFEERISMRRLNPYNANIEDNVTHYGDQ